MNSRNKARKIIEDEYGLDEIEIIQMSMEDLQAPGICMDFGCLNVQDCDQDTRNGICDVCENDTVHSYLILADMI